MTAVAGAAAATIIGFALNRLFPADGTTAIVVQFDQQRLHAVLERLGADFARMVDHSIREALLQQSFEEIKTKTLAARRFFSDHCATITPDQPRGDEAGLNNAYTQIELAYAALRQQIDRDLFHHAPTISYSGFMRRFTDLRVCEQALPPFNSMEERLRERDGLMDLHTNLYRHLEKAKAYMQACKTLVSLNVMIMARRCDLFPGLRRTVPDTLHEYRDILMRLEEHHIRLQKYRIQVDTVFNVNQLGDESCQYRYTSSILVKPEWHKARTPIQTQTGMALIPGGGTEKIYEIYEYTVTCSWRGDRCVVEANGPLGNFTFTHPIIERMPMRNGSALYTGAFRPFIAQKLEEHCRDFAFREPLYLECSRLRIATTDFERQLLGNGT